MQKYLFDMKKVLLSLGFMTLTALVSAQNIVSAPIGLVHNGDKEELSLPTTTVLVNITVQREEIKAGPYARYAQKCLALRAQLTDRTVNSIVSATIGVAENTDRFIAQSVAPTQTSVEVESLPVDQMSAAISISELAANDAATAIFNLRRQRRDIISGNAGEGYYGAGFKDAIQRLDQMEQEYIALFMGTRTITREVKQYAVDINVETEQYILCRYDQKSGIIPESDLSGVPVYLQVIPSLPVNTVSVEASIKQSDVTLYRVATMTNCTLFNNSEKICSVDLPIFQFGKTISVPAIRR